MPSRRHVILTTAAVIATPALPEAKPHTIVLGDAAWAEKILEDTRVEDMPPRDRPLT